MTISSVQSPLQYSGNHLSAARQEKGGELRIGTSTMVPGGEVGRATADAARLSASATGIAQVSMVTGLSGVDLGALLPARESLQALGPAEAGTAHKAYAEALGAIGGEMLPIAAVHHGEADYSLNP